MYVDTNKIKSTVMSLKNGRECGPEGVYADLIESRSEELFKMIETINS